MTLYTTQPVPCGNGKVFRIEKPVQSGNGIFGVFKSKVYAEIFDARSSASSGSISPSKTLVSRTSLVKILPGQDSAHDCERKSCHSQWLLSVFLNVNNICVLSYFVLDFESE